VASAEDARYRLRLGEGFLTEAQQDLTLGRRRSCVDNSQLSVENAAKSVLALLGPIGRTHSVAGLLRRAVHEHRFSPPLIPAVSRLADLAEKLAWDIHVASDYGDEIGRRTPWELFDETAAGEALCVAEEAVAIARPAAGSVHSRQPQWEWLAPVA